MKNFIKTLIPNFLKNKFIFHKQLTRSAKEEYLKDKNGLISDDPGIDMTIKNAIKWLTLAQDMSISKDGGVAAYYSLLNGWSTSYPETTGYIIPTIINYAKLEKNEKLLSRAKIMLDWLISIQFKDGSFQGGFIGDPKLIPNTFNSGQILIGLAAGVETFGQKYNGAMIKTGDWLVQTQDEDGCWRKFPSHKVIPGEKTYEAHVILGLLETAKVTGNLKYADAAIKNALWTLNYQNENGWFDKCTFDSNPEPLTHLIGYVFRGILEAYLYSKK